MRVFDTYYYNIIDKVNFKETKPYLEQMLKEQGYSYKNIAFMMDDFRKEPLEKVLSKLPSLQKYEFMEDKHGIADYGITSIRENWSEGEIYADEEDWADISTVFSKIPRPYNFSSGKLILDGINWFGDVDDDIAVADWYCGKEFSTADSPPFLSSRIIHYHFYNDGKKNNRICVTIEVTKEDGIWDSTSIIKKLESYLGTYDGFERVCTFDKEEFHKNMKLCELHGEKLQKLGDAFMPESEYVQRVRRQTYDDPKIPHVADKVTCNKIFKGTRFERVKGQPNWLHLYSYIDDKGYKYDAYIQKISIGNEFRCWIEISGYNFHIRYEPEDYIVEKEGESLDILRVFAQLCDKMVDEYSENLKLDFGVTPGWYH